MALVYRAHTATLALEVLQGGVVAGSPASSSLWPTFASASYLDPAGTSVLEMVKRPKGILGWWGGQEHSVGRGVGAYITVDLGLGGEQQAGELPAAAVSVHKWQGVLRIVLDHGGHRGKELPGWGGAGHP